MASRAYVASMTVAELTTELKQRGLSTKGRKKTLMERLEKAFDEEELNDPSSEEDSNSPKDGRGAATVDATTVQSGETRRDSESMIVAIELGNRENLEVRTNEVVKKNDEQMIVAIHLNNPQALRVKEDAAEAKQDEPNSLGAWSQEQPSEGAVTQPPSGLLCLTKCAKDTTTANICEAEPSGQLASKGHEVEHRMEVQDTAPVPSEGGQVQCSVGVLEGGTLDSSSVQSTAGAHEAPPVCLLSLNKSPQGVTSIVPELPTEAPNVSATAMASSDVDILPSTSSPSLDASIASGPCSLSGTSKHSWVQDKTLPGSSASVPQEADAQQQPTADLPVVVDSTLHARNNTSEPLDGVGREVGHEEVSQGGAEGQIDVDVVVYAEEDEFSMFSTEADEIQKFSARGKSSVAASTRGSSHDQVASSRDRKNGENPQPGVVTELAQVKKTSEKSEQSAVKKRRISAPTTPGADKGEPHERKRRWGSGNKQKVHGVTAVTTDISSDLLQEIIPAGIEEEIVREPSALEVVMSYGEDDCGEDGMEGKEKAAGSKETVDQKEKLREKETHQNQLERASQELETRRRIESRLKVKKEAVATAANAIGSHSPPKNPPSHILHLENLTRPFTLVQLKELLTEDGPMVKDGFWTNKVKSHCIIVYESQDVAVATCKRLHGMKWPSTNPKLLTADFLTIDEVAKISDYELVIKEEASEKRGGGGGEAVAEEDRSVAPEDQTTKTTAVDSGTVEAASSTAVLVSSAKPEQPEKQENTEEKSVSVSSPATEKAAKTLDTLFKRTVATPSIYWLPLTEAQANEKVTIEAAKDAERQKRREEREKELCAIREKEEQERKERDQKMQEEREKRREERRLRDEKDRKDRDEQRDRSRERRRQRSRSNSKPRSRSRSRERRRR